MLRASQAPSLSFLHRTRRYLIRVSSGCQYLAKKNSKRTRTALDDKVIEDLLAARAAAQLTQEVAGEAAGTTGQTVYNWEHGEGVAGWKIRLAYLRLLANRNMEARRIVARLVGLPPPEDKGWDRSVEELAELLQEGRAKPGWDHVAFMVRSLVEAQAHREREKSPEPPEIGKRPPGGAEQPGSPTTAQVKSGN